MISLDEKIEKERKRILEAIKTVLDQKQIPYEEEKPYLLYINTTYNEVLIEYYIRVSGACKLLFISMVPMILKAGKNIEVAVLANEINVSRSIGNIEFHLDDEKIYYKLSSSHYQTKLNEHQYTLLFNTFIDMIYRYNILFMKFNEDLITYDQFMEMIERGE